jgi:hypothetical protein
MELLYCIAVVDIVVAVIADTAGTVCQCVVTVGSKDELEEIL